MLSRETVVVFEPTGNNALLERLPAEFDYRFYRDHQSCLTVARQEARLLVIDGTRQSHTALALCEALQQQSAEDCLPVLFYAASAQLQDKLRAFELGADDYLLCSMSEAELQARMQKALFNKIANDQLKSRMQQASALAYTAMANTSELGTNIQFLLDSYHCRNLDELGLLFFRAVKNYHLNCSIQLRSEFGVKNMEANGMAKDLESQLLAQLQGEGRFYDFGRRTVINYQQVSVLIKNMPLDNPERYGAIKDNIFALVQGLDARVSALDSVAKVALENQLLAKLIAQVQSVMHGVDDSYQRVMRDIATVVDDMADTLSGAIPSMGLSEAQETVIESAVESGILSTQRVFSQGLKVDEHFMGFVDSMNDLLSVNAAALPPQKLRQWIRQLDQSVSA